MSARALRWWPAVLIVSLAGWMLLLEPDMMMLRLTFPADLTAVDPVWPISWGWWGTIPAAAMAFGIVTVATPAARWLGRNLGHPRLFAAGCWLFAAGAVGNTVGAIASGWLEPVVPGTAVDVWHIGYVWTNPADFAVIIGALMVIFGAALGALPRHRLLAVVATGIFAAFMLVAAVAQRLAVLHGRWYL